MLTDADDRIEAEAVAVISHRYWQRRFDGDPAILDRAIQVNRVPVTIVGITPEGFDGIRMTETTDVTIPMAMASRVESGTTRPVSMWWMQIMARLKPGVQREQAMADVERLFDDSARESWAARPSSSTKPGTSKPRLGIMSGGQGSEAPRRDALPVLAAIAGVTIAVLVIACVNIANLVLVRTSTAAGDSASCLVGREPRPGPEARAGRERSPRARGRSARDRLGVLGPELSRLASGNIGRDCRCANRLASDRVRASVVRRDRILCGWDRPCGRHVWISSCR